MRLPTYQQLSKEQDRIYNLPLDQSCLVTGPPGTGKTIMALYRARALQEARRRCQLLMYGRLLMQYVRSAIEELELNGVTDTFHSWFGKLWRKWYGNLTPQVAPYEPDWQTILIKLNTSPPSSNGNKPHLIVDEAQDFPKEFFLTTRLIASGMTVFADENQRIKEQNSTIQEIKTYSMAAGREFTLTKNYRNTREIARLARHFYTGLASGMAEDPDRGGERPRMCHFSSLNDEIEWISTFVKNNDDLEIGVLIPTRKLQSMFFNRLSARLPAQGQVQQYRGGKGAASVALDWDRPGVKVVNYASAKGLEFDAVFVPHLEDMPLDWEGVDIRMLFYVLCTRARSHLFFSYSGDPPPGLGIFPPDGDTLEYD